jgi:starvation-inducible DNA-binding protein
MADIKYTVPGLDLKAAKTLCGILQKRLTSMNDLQLTLKHAHWNVVGPDFIGVHEMLDPQIELVRGFADDIAERIAMLGGSPVGVPGKLTEDRDWDDYSLGRDTTTQHLKAIDRVYDGVVTSHRKAIEKSGELDPVTEDLLIGQAFELEKFQWFVRAHLETAAGSLPSGQGDAGAKKKK